MYSWHVHPSAKVYPSGCAPKKHQQPPSHRSIPVRNGGVVKCHQTFWAILPQLAPTCCQKTSTSLNNMSSLQSSFETQISFFKRNKAPTSNSYTNHWTLFVGDVYQIQFVYLNPKIELYWLLMGTSQFGSNSHLIKIPNQCFNYLISR